MAEKTGVRTQSAWSMYLILGSINMEVDASGGLATWEGS